MGEIVYLIHGSRFIHQVVRTALEKDGWNITDDPLRLLIGIDTMFIDLAAKRLIAASKGQEFIAVEVVIQKQPLSMVFMEFLGNILITE